MTVDDLAPLREALGDLLAAHRATSGFTQRDLARVIGYARTTVGTAEAGHRLPSRSFWARCDQQLGAGGELLRAYEALVVGQQRRRAALAAQDQAARVARGSIAGGLVTAAGPAPADSADSALDVGWELAARRRFRPTRQLLEDDVDPITRRYRSLYHQLPSVDLLPAVMGHLRLVHGLLGGAEGGTRRSLGSTVAETAGFAAWLCGDLGQRSQMLRLYRLAEDAVVESGDRALGGYVRGFYAQALAGGGEHRQGINEAQAAVKEAGRSAAPAVLGWLSVVHAMALAAGGQPRPARAALADAERYLDQGSGDERPEWMYDFDRPRFDAHAGACYLQIGVPAEAEPVLRRALVGLSPGGRRRAEVSLDLAGALLGGGEAEEAAELAGRAADQFGSWDSAAGLDRVTAFAGALRRAGDVAAARSLTERVVAYRRPAVSV
jgi:tetratricopeptide (TPR) repeat protein